MYRGELDANLDLNPALAELMFTRHIMNKLEASVFALKVQRECLPSLGGFSCLMRRRRTR